MAVSNKRDVARDLVLGEVYVDSKHLTAHPGLRSSGVTVASTKTPTNDGWNSDTPAEQRIAVTSAFMAEAARRLGAEPGDRWVFVDQYVWQLVKPDHRPLHAKGFDPSAHPGICCRWMHGEGYGSGSTCGRPVGDKHPTLCNVHGAVETRKQTNEDARRRKHLEHEAESQRIDRLAVDLRADWELACDVLAIEPERRGRATVTNGGRSGVVDREVLVAMLRTIVERLG